MTGLSKHLKRKAETYLWVLLAASMVMWLAGCSEETPRERRARVERDTYSTLQGEVPLSGGGVGEVRTFEVDGTQCILVGRYSALAVSCNWSKP
jgi:hypothetical protein